MPWATSELGLGPAPASLLPSRKVGREAAAALPANQAQPGGHSTASQTGYRPGLGPHVPTQGDPQGHALHTVGHTGPWRLTWVGLGAPGRPLPSSRPPKHLPPEGGLWASSGRPGSRSRPQGH